MYTQTCTRYSIRLCPLFDFLPTVFLPRPVPPNLNLINHFTIISSFQIIYPKFLLPGLTTTFSSPIILTVSIVSYVLNTQQSIFIVQGYKTYPSSRCVEPEISSISCVNIPNPVIAPSRMQIMIYPLQLVWAPRAGKEVQWSWAGLGCWNSGQSYHYYTSTSSSPYKKSQTALHESPLSKIAPRPRRKSVECASTSTPRFQIYLLALDCCVRGEVYPLRLHLPFQETSAVRDMRSWNVDTDRRCVDNDGLFRGV